MLWACELLTTGEPLPWLDGFSDSETDFRNLCNSDVQHEAVYVCDACGEDIVIPLDLSQGAFQTYVEDCPVCCRANTIYVHLDEDGTFQIRAEPEQDYD
ncbi:MAG: CPXCG motif-containing cysteine-rich protein [Planctomyces sp.]|nr:CPXCG motif-containing cysteine-rich protein [Planctomyces sp.]